MEMPRELTELLARWPDWVLPTEKQRKQKRTNSSFAQITEFYKAVQPHMPAIASYLDNFPTATIQEEHMNLLLLAFIFMEAAVAVEFYKAPELPVGFSGDRFHITELQAG